MGTLVLNSKGLNRIEGSKIISRALDDLGKKNEDLRDREKLRLFAVSVPGYGVDIALAEDFDTNTVGRMRLTALGLFNGTIIPHYTKSEVKRYLSFKDEHVRNRYSKIYAVGNDDVVTMSE